MPTLPSPNELFKKAQSFEKIQPSLLEKYKESILLLKNEKGLTLIEIEKFLNENGIDIKKHKISKFLKSINPIKTNKEKNSKDKVNNE